MARAPPANAKTRPSQEGESVAEGSSILRAPYLTMPLTKRNVALHNKKCMASEQDDSLLTPAKGGGAQAGARKNPECAPNIAPHNRNDAAQQNGFLATLFGFSLFSAACSLNCLKADNGDEECGEDAAVSAKRRQRLERRWNRGKAGGTPVAELVLDAEVVVEHEQKLEGRLYSLRPPAVDIVSSPPPPCVKRTSQPASNTI